MKIITVTLLTLVVSTLAAAPQAPTPPVGVKQFNDGIHWIVIEPFAYQIGQSKLRVEVPKGFVTDYASIPKPFTALFLPTGRYGRAAIVHDFLYWTQSCSRDQADRIFLFAMIESNVPTGTRNTIYEAVHQGGASSWLANQTERKVGMPRIIPEGFMNIGALDEWANYRQRLYKWGVRAEPSTTKPAAYCAADENDLK